MNLSAAALRLMADKGLTLEDVAEIVAANESRDPTNAQRQARHRAKKKVESNGVTVTGVTPSPNDIDILTPTHSPKVISSEITPPIEKPLTENEVVEAWNERMVPQGFPAVRRLTSTRHRQLRARLKENTLDDWQQAMAALERSAFCRGENDRGWRADFDFLLQPKSFTKLLEGAYDH